MPLPLLAILAAMAGTAGAGAAIGSARRDGMSRNPLDDEEGADTIDPGVDGAFPSFLEALGRPGKIVNNLLVGNWEGAGRQGVDLLGDAVDSVLPGDWIPHISRRKDKPDFSDVIGGMDPGIGKFAVDVVGGAATDPTMLIPGVAFAKAGKAGSELLGGGVRALDALLPGTADVAANVGEKAAGAGRWLREVAGAERMTPEVKAIRDQALAAGQSEAAAGLGALGKGALAALAPEERTIVSDVMDNMLWKDGKPTSILSPQESALDRIAAHPGVTPENQGRIADAVKQVVEIGQTQAGRPNIFAKGNLPKEYLGRSWSGQTEEQAINEALGLKPTMAGGANATKEMTLDTPEAMSEFMAANPKMAFERDALTRMAKRAEAQGTLTSRAEVGKSLVGDEFAYADPAMRAQAMDKIREMAATDPESAKVLLNTFQGMAPRGAVTSMLAKANVPFKRAAVSGFIIPKFGADVRNRVSGIWQAASNPESRAAVPGMMKRFVSDIASSVTDALGMKMGKDRFAKILGDWEDSLSASGGSGAKAIELMKAKNPNAAALIQSGILDGYTRAEDLVKDLGRTPFKQKLKTAAEFPQRIMRGLEDRMRLGMGLDLMDAGKSAQDAARITGDSLYRYGSSSAANRTARDIIPFFQFTAKAIPQQAKLLAEKPWLASGLSRAYDTDPEAPIYPYMQGKLNIPLGLDEQGNQQFASGLGLPFESLNMIPDASGNLSKLGRSLERDTVGAAHPVLKSLFGLVSGEDPYFETGYGSYSKVPLLGDLGEAGKKYNVAAGTGLLQPLDSPLRLLGQVADDRRSVGTKAVDLLTGANVVNVDPNRALQQQLQSELEANPDVQQYKGLYSTSKDPSTVDMLHKYQAAKARAKASREALLDVR